MKTRLRFPFFLGGGLFIVGLSLYGFILLYQRPGIPPAILPAGVVRVDDVEVRTSYDLNYALSKKEVGAPTDFYVRATGGQIQKITAPLVPYYARSAYPSICLLIGLLSIGLGVLTFGLRPADLKARIFYWLALCFAAVLVIVSGEYNIHPMRWSTYLPTFCFILCYALVPALLLHFSLSFSPPSYRVKRTLLYLPGLFFAAVQEGLFLSAYLLPSLRPLRLYSQWYFVFRIYLAVYILAALLHLGRAYRQSQIEEPRSQIKWIFFGLTVGVTPFLFLYQLPRVLNLSVQLSEEASNIFFIIIPVAVAIAIVRYRLMDITLVINRSLVYSLLTIFIVGLYLFVVQVAQNLLTRLIPVRQVYFSAAGVFLAAMAFHPAQKRIQDFVDRAFFRQRYDYRRLVFDFNERARHFAAADRLAGYFLQEVRRALQVEKMGLAIHFRSQAGEGGEVPLRLGDPLGLDRLTALAGRDGARVWARRAAVQTGDLVDFSEEKALEGEAVDLALALPLSAGVGSGWLALGKKRSGQRYGRDDIELLRTMAAEMSVHLERIRLQEEVIYERASIEKLDELNRLKTEFISSVSHELRTPMSAIQGLAEVLQAGKLKGKEEKERYLNLMVTESGRLSRFLQNVLDFGRIEQGAKAYQFQTADLRVIVAEAVDIFRGALESQGFRLSLRLPDHPVERSVDPDAIKQALINLIDNAMKYSEGQKTIDVELRAGQEAEILVRDGGIGIAPEDLPRIFDQFFRAEKAARLCAQGAGLGLKITRLIMEAHGGEVRVDSREGRGSTFRLIFRGS